MAKRQSTWLCAGAVLLLAAGSASTNPWFGTWKLMIQRPDEKPETLVYSDAGQGAMRMLSVEDKSELITHFDGKPAKNTGTDGGRVFAIKAVYPTSYTWTFLKAGKPYVRGRNILSADHQFFSEVSWLIAKPEKTKTFIYDKQ